MWTKDMNANPPDDSEPEVEPEMDELDTAYAALTAAEAERDEARTIALRMLTATYRACKEILGKQQSEAQSHLPKDMELDAKVDERDATIERLRAELEEAKAQNTAYREDNEKQERLRSHLAGRAEKAEAELERLQDLWDCDGETHGPWCREWRKMEAELAQLRDALTAAADAHGGAMRDCHCDACVECVECVDASPR